MSEVIPRFRYGSIQLDEYPYGVIRDDGGVDIGTAEPQMEEIGDLLPNGGVMLASRTNNRTLVVPVVIEGSDLKEVAEAAAALYAECRKDYNEFSLTPGSLGAETVFDTYAATPTTIRDDRYEAALIRRIDLVIPAAPWPRSAALSTSTATPTTGTPTSVTISDGSTLTGWSGAATVGAAGGIVYSTGWVSSRWLAFATVQTMTSTPYFYVDWHCYGAGVTRSFECLVDGVAVAAVASTPGPYPGWTRTYFERTTNITAEIRFVANQSATPATLEIDQIVRTNVLPGRTRERSLLLPVDGAAPTEGSLHVSHATDALGDVLIYTSTPDNPRYTPNLRQYYGGAGTPDSSLVSGAFDVVSSPWACSIPAVNLPEGTYAIWVRVSCTSATEKAMSWSSSVLIDADNPVLGSDASGSLTVTFAAADTWTLFPIGLVQLPSVVLDPGSTATVSFTIQGDFGMKIDEAWLFNVTTGDLSVVLGTPLAGGTPPVVRNVWVDSPTIERPTPTVWRGQAPDKSDAYGAGPYVLAGARHRLNPPQIAAFLVTTLAENPTLTLDHYARWPDYAAD